MAKIPRTREPAPGTEAAKLIERWRKAGIEIKMEDANPHEHRLLFFGRVPEEGGGGSPAPK